MSTQPDDDIWGAQQPSSAKGDVESAFTEPSMVVDAEAADASPDQSVVVEDKKSKKPNLVILGAAAAIGLAVLGGTGFVGYQEYLKYVGRSKAGISLAGPEITVPVADAGPLITGAQSAVGSATGGGVFDAPAAPAGAAQAIPGAGADQNGPTTPVAPAAPKEEIIASNDVAKVRSLDAKELSEAAAAASKSAVAVDQTASALKAASLRNAAQEKAKPKANDVAVRKEGIPAENVATARKQMASPVSAQSQRRVAAATSTSKPKAKVKAKEPVPVQVPSDDVRVVGVYPLTGKNAQAWVRNKQGETKVVRQGDVINGIAILSVVPEKGLVKTSLGDLTSSGFVR